MNRQILIFITILLILLISVLSLQANEGIGYIFRYKTVEKKFYMHQVNTYILPENRLITRSITVPFSQPDYLFRFTGSNNLFFHLTQNDDGRSYRTESPLDLARQSGNNPWDRLSPYYVTTFNENVNEQMLLYSLYYGLEVSSGRINNAFLSDSYRHVNSVLMNVYPDNSEDQYFDLYFYPPLSFPRWTKSAEIWIYGMRPEMEISFYYMMNNYGVYNNPTTNPLYEYNVIEYEDSENQQNLRSIYHFNNPTPDEWERFSMNFSCSNTCENENQAIVLTKVRFLLKRTDTISPSLIELRLTDFTTNNFIITPQNLQNNPLHVYENFNDPGIEDTSNFIWDCRMNGYLRPCSDIVSYYADPSDFNPDNGSTQISIGPVQGSVIVDMKGTFRKFYKGSDICILAEGIPEDFIGGEKLSVIYQEGLDRFFELELGMIQYPGKYYYCASIPEEEITWYYDEGSDRNFIYLLGFKVSPGYSGNVNVRLDELLRYWNAFEDDL